MRTRISDVAGMGYQGSRGVDAQVAGTRTKMRQRRERDATQTRGRVVVDGPETWHGCGDDAEVDDHSPQVQALVSIEIEEFSQTTAKGAPACIIVL
jgi:hypothetical protein